MNKIQVMILVVLGVSVVAVFSGLGVVVYNTMSSCPTPCVGKQEHFASVIVPVVTTIPAEKPLPTVQIAGGQNETTCRVEAFLRDLGYNVVGVRAVTNGAGDRALVAYVRDSTMGAEDTLMDVNSVLSLYVPAASPPFDSASVVIYSPENEVIIVSVVLREDVEAWLDGGIGTDQFINRVLIQSQ